MEMIKTNVTFKPTFLSTDYVLRALSDIAEDNCHNLAQVCPSFLPQELFLFR